MGGRKASNLVVRKRTTRKTGNYSKSTRTLSSTGRVTQSFSSKPPGASTRRTVSFSNGKMRTTYSNKQGGNWTQVKTKTMTLVSKAKPIKTVSFSFGRSDRKKKEKDYDDGEPGEFSWFWFMIGIIVYPFLLPFKLFGIWIGWAFYLFIYFYFFG